jgi:sialic acid synthase SpsE/D-lyxose ketol-isomerase
MLTKIPEKLFIFELANNHMGDISHGIRIVKKFGEISKKYPQFKFAFKLQFRDLDSFIHKEFHKRNDIHYIKRFNDTELSKKNLQKLVYEIKKKKFISICTPFDEKSVDLINKLKIQIIKVASCSFNDWPLLEKIVQSNKPIIASTAGAKEIQIDNVVSFFKNRNKNFALMHCVAQYPTPNKNLNLEKIKYLKNKYPKINIGYSTHEDPFETNIISLAIAMGATIFEKHVGLKTERYPLNKYSASPKEVLKWLDSAKKAWSICGKSKNIFNKNTNEIQNLINLKRGVFAKKNLKKNSILTQNDIYFAFPPQHNQVLADQISKYSEIKTIKNIKKDNGLSANNTIIKNNRLEIFNIIKKANELLKKSNHKFSGNIEYEISHHYGLKKFYKYGLVMLNLINGEYCKKILVVLPGQTHPEQFHFIKKETFHILYGKLLVKLNNKSFVKITGELLTIEPKVKHEFYSKNGAVIEEISTNYNPDDSFYTDNKIQKNKLRKIKINYFWE